MVVMVLTMIAIPILEITLGIPGEVVPVSQKDQLLLVVVVYATHITLLDIVEAGVVIGVVVLILAVVIMYFGDVVYLELDVKITVDPRQLVDVIVEVYVPFIILLGVR